MITDRQIYDGDIGARAYFVAHAPAVIPEWFHPTMRERPAFNAGNLEKSRVELEEWQAEYHRERSFQWPLVWADAMIAQLQKAESK